MIRREKEKEKEMTLPQLGVLLRVAMIRTHN